MRGSGRRRAEANTNVLGQLGFGVFSISHNPLLCRARRTRRTMPSLFCFATGVLDRHHPKTAIFQRNLFCLPFAFLLLFKIKRKENSKRESAGQAHEQQIPVLRFVFVRFALLNGGIRVFVVHGIPYISVCCFMRSAKSFVCFPVPPPQLCAIFMQQVTQPIDNVHPQLISI